MGERLTRLAVTGFRGVPTNWEIEWPAGASMVVRGDNGTGKSTIADALEWYFNGRVEFLSKEGRDRAIRHVGAPTAVKTSVEVSTTGSLGGKQVMPPFGTSPWIPALVRDKFVLRGRTLSDFVEQPKAQKWKTLAEILGLQEIDSLRLDLQTVRNQLEEEARRTTEEAERAEAALSGRLKAVDEENLLAAIQGECVAADLALPASLDEALDPNWSTVAVSSQTATRAIAASTLLADVKSSRLTRVTFGGVDEWNTHVASANTALSDRLRFMSAAGTLLRSQTDDGYCPLCGQAASRLSISTRVAAALEDLQSAAEAHEKAENALRVTMDSLAAHRRLLEDLRRQCVAAGISSLDDVPTSPYDAVSGGLLAGAPIRRKDIDEYVQSADAWLDAAEETVSALPPAPSRETGLVRLGTLCEQGRRWRSASTSARSAGIAFGRADRLHATYQRFEAEQYQLILHKISDRVAGMYSVLHPGEGFTGVAIEPWTEKGLELALDFHGTTSDRPMAS